MLVFSTGESAPTQHTQWVVWRQLIAIYRVFGITNIRPWARLVARFDTRGIHPPGCMARIPSDQMMAVDWELRNPDMMVRIWQAARHGAVDLPRALPRSEMTPQPDHKSQYSRYGRIRAIRPKSDRITTPMNDSDLPSATTGYPDRVNFKHCRLAVLPQHGSSSAPPGRPAEYDTTIRRITTTGILGDAEL